MRRPGGAGLDGRGGGDGCRRRGGGRRLLRGARLAAPSWGGPLGAAFVGGAIATDKLTDGLVATGLPPPATTTPGSTWMLVWGFKGWWAGGGGPPAAMPDFERGVLEEGSSELRPEASPSGATLPPECNNPGLPTGDAAAKGGTYYLLDPVTGEVVRTGRTNDLERRRREHERDPLLSHLTFQVDIRTDDPCEQRGREQIIHDHYGPRLNRIRPISPRNPALPDYIEAGERFPSPESAEEPE